MDERKEIQKEFFQEFGQQAKSRKKPLKADNTRRIYELNLTNEQLIFVFIGLVILLVICFSLGVERGKRIVIAKKDELSAVSHQLSAQSQETRTAGSQKLTTEGQKPEVEIPKIAEPLPIYVVQVAAYKNSKQAEEEKKLLEKRGYTAGIAKNVKYSVVYVGEFASKDDAQKVSKELKDRYKDCFVKKRK